MSSITIFCKKDKIENLESGVRKFAYIGMTKKSFEKKNGKLETLILKAGNYKREFEVEKIQSAIPPNDDHLWLGKDYFNANVNRFCVKLKIKTPGLQIKIEELEK